MQTAQKTIDSRFNAKSTATEIAAGHDLTGKTALVTGGNSGLGFETVKALAAAGAHVVTGARDISKAARRLTALGNVSFFPLDLSDPASVDAFAEKFLAQHDTLHFLINNAGLMRPPEYATDKRGFEIQFGINHLGHFQLAARLWPALKKAAGARVVALSSIGHRYMGIRLDDINFEHHPYDKGKAYGQSKTANSLFAVELDKRGQQYGVRAFAVHPGAIMTDIIRYMTDEELEAFTKRVEGKRVPLQEGFKNAEQGAATSVWCALSEQLTGLGGVYCEDCNIAGLVPDDPAITHGVRAYAIDPAQAAALWQFSEKVTGLNFP